MGAGPAGQDAALGLLEMGANVRMVSRGKEGLERARRHMPEHLVCSLPVVFICAILVVVEAEGRDLQRAGHYSLCIGCAFCF